MKHQPTGRSQSGFSLVEVTLAVAIASLAIITLLGLLPQGLEMARKTSMLTNNSSILEQVIRNYENMQWTGLPANGIVTKFYSDEGLEVSSDSKEISYVVSIDFSQQAALPADTNQMYLRRVVIKVASSSNTSFQFGPNNKASYAVFNYTIAKSR